MSEVAPDSPVEVPAPRWPRWLDEVDLTVPVCSQFTLYGNIRDNYLIPIDSMAIEVPLVEALWVRLRPRGYDFLLVYDPSAGLSVHPSSARQAATAALANAPLGQSIDFVRFPEPKLTLQFLPALIDAVYANGSCGLVVQNASRLLNSATEVPQEMLEQLAACARSAQAALPRAKPGQRQPLFNPVFWLLDSMRDLPPWLVVGGDRSRAVSVAFPDSEDRFVSALELVPTVTEGTVGAELTQAAQTFALRAEGLTLREMAAVAHLARDQQIPIDRIGDAIRSYRVGITDDPWSKPMLRHQIADGESEIGRYVKGQEAAVRQTLDILIRSVMGLHGAQASSSSSRPRGILFFAGPTGVGKTELAKAVSRLVFGDPDACLRFDMSEFSAEHSEARLIGAPPGYVGYDAGGELVNAVRQRPFSIILFDEIEKAHPRILDKFLQILEDGRLTDGRGDTVYFSETLLIFTSNLGIVGRDAEGRPTMLVTPNDSYETVKSRVREEIGREFRERMGRPELLNRIGENIVVFNFIRDDVAAEIFDKAIDNVFERVRRTCDIRLRFGPGVRETLLARCTNNLADGGRGIGNQLESTLVNPLARELFFHRPAGPEVEISEFVDDNGKYSVRLQ